jgi:D-apionolactonase
MSSQAFLYCGAETHRPIELRAGLLTMRFEPETAFLRHLRLGDHEVVRAIYAAIRDQDWATISPQITIHEQEIKPDSFRIVFDAVCRRGRIDYFWRGTVTGDEDGRVQYIFDGEARSDFQRNRIGICVLHPIVECAGKPVSIKHSDGSAENGVFPRDISPHQPFFDIKEISCEAAGTGINAKLEMDGDIFEMEDQRNWSDASFKTYCTPQARPKPHPVTKGDRVRQSVTLTLSGKVRTILPVNLGRPPQLSISTTPVVALPPIGLCVASHRRPLVPREIERLKALRLSHLRVDLSLDDPSYPALLEQTVAEARAIGAGLHIALGLGANFDQQVNALLPHLERLKPPVLLWIVLHDSENPASESAVQRVRPALQKFAPNVLFAAGTRDFFTEINRDRPPADSASSICYSNNPQVHAFDNTTLIENLAGQAYNVETARTFTARPVAVSPITLRIRNNASAAAEKPGALAELPSDVDPRQLSLFGAGWTLGSIARLAATGFVHSLTYYETTGWRGLMETEAGSPLPKQFPSAAGAVFPLYHVFADIAEFGAKQIYPTHATHPLVAEGLTLVDASGGRRILVANLTGDPQDLKIKTGTCIARVRYLDETTAEQATRRPEEFRAQPGEQKESVSGKIELKLLPYALARVEVG